MASFALFCLAFIAVVSQQILVDADAIAKTCDKIELKDLCQSIFAAHPESRNADTNHLARIAFDEAIKQAKDIQLNIKGLSKSSGDMKTKRSLNDCLKLYGEAIVAMEKSKTTLESQKVWDSKKLLHFNQWALLYGESGQMCERRFMESGGGASPLTKMNHKFDDICSIVFTITSKLADVKA